MVKRKRSRLGSPLLRRFPRLIRGGQFWPLYSVSKNVDTPPQKRRRLRSLLTPCRSSQTLTSSKVESASASNKCEIQSLVGSGDITGRNIVEATVGTVHASGHSSPPPTDEFKSLARDPAISVADAASQCLEKETNMRFWWKATKAVSGFSEFPLSQCIVDCMYSSAVSEGNECLPFAVDAALCIAKEDELIIEWLRKRGHFLTNDEYALCRKIRWIAYRLFIFEGSWSSWISAALVDIRKQAERLVENLRLDSDEPVATPMSIRQYSLDFIVWHMHYKYQLDFSAVRSEMPSESTANGDYGTPIEERASEDNDSSSYNGTSSDGEMKWIEPTCEVSGNSYPTDTSSDEETSWHRTEKLNGDSKLCGLPKESEQSAQACGDGSTPIEKTGHKSSERASEVSRNSSENATSSGKETKWHRTEKLNGDSKLCGLPEESEQSAQAYGPSPLPPVSPNYADEFNSLESDRLRPHGKGPCDKKYKKYLKSFYKKNKGSGVVSSVDEAAFLCLEKENHKNFWRDAKSVGEDTILDEWIVSGMFSALKEGDKRHTIGVEAALCLAKEAELLTEWLKKRGRNPLFHNKEEYGLWYQIRDVAYNIFGRRGDWMCPYIGGALVGIRKEAERLLKNLRLGSDESITTSLKIRKSALAVIREIYVSYSAFLLEERSEGSDENDESDESVTEEEFMKMLGPETREKFKQYLGKSSEE